MEHAFCLIRLNGYNLHDLPDGKVKKYIDRSILFTVENYNKHIHVKKKHLLSGSFLVSTSKSAQPLLPTLLAVSLVFLLLLENIIVWNCLQMPTLTGTLKEKVGDT